MKKILSLVLALVMVLAVTVASAASITINRDTTYDSETNQAYTYNAYKIFDASYNSLTGTGTQSAKDPTYSPADAAVSYFMKTGNPWISTVQGMTSYFTVTAAADGSGYSVGLKSGVENNATTALAIVTALKNALSSLTLSGEYAGIEIQAGSAATNVDAGYYMIVGDDNANLAIVTTDVTIVEKNEYPKLIKEFSDETTVGEFTSNPHSDETSSASDTVQVGDTVSYTLTIQIPTGANQAMTVTDTYTSGLAPVTAESGVVAITLGNMAANTTATASAPANGSFTVTISEDDVIANAGRTISITYSAIVTADAWIQLEDNTGKVKYGNVYETKPDHVDSNTFWLEIDKKAGSEEGDSLEGAKFELYRNGANNSKTIVNVVAITDEELEEKNIEKAANTVYYRVVAAGTTGATTTIDMEHAYNSVIYGLDGDSTYSIREIQAPTGYNKLENDIDVAMNKQNHVQPVVNNAGTVLPSTGGIGTTIFYVLGGILVIGAAVILVARRKAHD